MKIRLMFEKAFERQSADGAMTPKSRACHAVLRGPHDVDTADTLTGSVQLDRIDVRQHGPYRIPLSSPPAGLSPSREPEVFALATARIPGGGFVTGSSDGKILHLGGRGEVTGHFLPRRHQPVYGLCMLDEQLLLGCSAAPTHASPSPDPDEGKPFVLSLWDVRTHQLIGERGSAYQYVHMDHLGSGFVIGRNHSRSGLWLHDLAEDRVRALSGTSSEELIMETAVLSHGGVAAIARARHGQAAPRLLVWHFGDVPSVHKLAPPSEVDGMQSLVMLDDQRLLVMGSDLNHSAIWRVGEEDWTHPPDFCGSLVGYRWSSLTPELEARCREYPRGALAGGVNPNALAHWTNHVFLEKQGEDLAAWDIQAGTPAWDGSLLVDSPAGAGWGRPFKVLTLSP